MSEDKNPAEDDRVTPARMSVDPGTPEGSRTVTGFFAYEVAGDEHRDLGKFNARVLGKQDIEAYRSTKGLPYKAPEGAATGYVSIPVLEFLVGLPLNNLVLSYVHALGPTVIRVTDGFVTLDARVGRVTVMVDVNNNVTKISMEVGVLYGCGEDVTNVLTALKHGKEPPKAYPRGSRVYGDTKGLERLEF